MASILNLACIVMSVLYSLSSSLAHRSMLDLAQGVALHNPEAARGAINMVREPLAGLEYQAGWTTLAAKEIQGPIEVATEPDPRSTQEAIDIVDEPEPEPDLRRGHQAGLTNAADKKAQGAVNIVSDLRRGGQAGLTGAADKKAQGAVNTVSETLADLEHQWPDPKSAQWPDLRRGHRAGLTTAAAKKIQGAINEFSEPLPELKY